MTPSVLLCFRSRFRTYLRTSIAALCTCGVLLLVPGCASPPLPQAEYTTATPKAADILTQADSAQSPERDELLAKAAAIQVNSGDTNAALETYGKVNPAMLSRQMLADYVLNYAALAVAHDEFFLARELLGKPAINQQSAQWPASQQAQLLRLRGDLFALLGETSASITAYTQLARTTNDTGAIQDIHDTIWRVLNHSSNQHLLELHNAATTRDLKGWYQLALVSRREQSNLSHHQQAITQWQQDWVDHPASLALPSFITRASTGVERVPQKLALLLPLQGPYATAASTIRDGIMASLFNTQRSGATAPKVEVYDTTGEDIVALYQRAVSEGAEAVIGPLRREQLEVLSRQPALPIPVTGLNYLDQETAQTPGNFYQFGLSVADEASQAARRAWIEGRRSALILVPDTTWGLRARDAFEQAFRANGGRIAAAASYEMGLKDFSSVIRPLLLVDQSSARVNELQRTLGKALEHAPNRRQDVDMIFLVAYPNQGRQIKPTLDFFYAHDLPVYATSHIYAGIEDPRRDNDLDRIRFTAMPWTLDADTEVRPGKDLAPAFRHLFALGADAYQLQQWLGLMDTLNDATFNGYTGTLTVPTNHRIRREQPWARFRNGKVYPGSGFRDD
ncbi:MAG: penicillin-binding protein activator [Porticoccaceae bacterium]|nr:penicillin-binding protein activator [Porticoccaceae bacterium]